MTKQNLGPWQVVRLRPLSLFSLHLPSGSRQKSHCPLSVPEAASYNYLERTASRPNSLLTCWVVLNTICHAFCWMWLWISREYFLHVQRLPIEGANLVSGYPSSSSASVKNTTESLGDDPWSKCCRQYVVQTTLYATRDKNCPHFPLEWHELLKFFRTLLL